VHWTQPAGTDRHELSLTSEFLDIRAYYAGTTAAVNGWRELDEEDWALVSATLRDDTFEVRVRGLSSAAPATAGTSAPIAGGLSREDLLGGVYYWAASAGSIMRHDFGAPDVAPEQYYSATDAGQCVGCHSISLDGTRLYVRRGGGDLNQFTVLDVATRAELFPYSATLVASMASFSPDGSKVLTASGGDLTVRDAPTGMALASVLVPGRLSHPAWSPLGDRIAYVNSETSHDVWVSDGAIVVHDVDPLTGALGALRVVAECAPAECYYPHFSPDGEWLVYNRAETGNSYNNANARVYVVKADGSLPPALQATADVGPALTNTWPRWAPFETSIRGGVDGDQSLMWILFTSRRAFGVRTTGSPAQLWMAPFYPERAATGVDASGPAFRLPFQAIGTHNHIAEMTEEIVVVE
jgi:TolB protein